MATQRERRERTRAAIIDAASALFAERGYAETSIADVLVAADVSRGALYHHFESKEEVFAAVFESVSADAIDRAAARARHADTHLGALRDACAAWLDISVEPLVAQTLFVEGPRALGWDRCRDLEDRASLGRVRASLSAAVDAGEVSVDNVDLTARVINAALTEVSLAMHHGSPPTGSHDAHRTIDALISGLTS